MAGTAWPDFNLDDSVNLADFSKFSGGWMMSAILTMYGVTKMTWILPAM